METLSAENVVISCEEAGCGFCIAARVILGPDSAIHFTNKNDEAAIAEHHRDTGKNNFLRGGHSEYKLKIFEDAFLELVVHGGEETGWMVTGKRS